MQEEEEALSGEDSEGEIEVPEGMAEVEEPVVSMFSVKDNKTVKVMKFKGEIRKLPIYALLDSGSTHSFVNPTVIKGNEHHLTHTIPMIVIVANRARMVTDQQCKALQFSIQGHNFEKDMRVLDIGVRLAY
jgi:Retroviral aspartyl protease